MPAMPAWVSAGFCSFASTFCSSATPFSSYYNALVENSFLYDFYDTIDRIVSDTGVSYYDYSHDERFSDNLIYFSDPDHLNEEGARYFMEILEEEIPELQEVLSAPQ